MECKYCKHYEHILPTWQEPYEDIYCNKFNMSFFGCDESQIELKKCQYFIIDTYWQKILREEKLSRILDNS